MLAVKTRRARWVVPCNRVALKVERCLLGWELKPTHGTLVMALEPLHNAVKMEWVAAWHDLQGVHVATPIEEARACKLAGATGAKVLSGSALTPRVGVCVGAGGEGGHGIGWPG